MVNCPNPSDLPTFCVGGQLSPAVCPDDTEWPDIRVDIELVDGSSEQPIRDQLFDPTSCATLLPSKSTTIHERSDGCWCTCDLFANYSSVDGANALNPPNTAYKIQLFIGDANKDEWTPAGQPFIIKIDADYDYSSLDECCTITGPCGTCINVRCLQGLDTAPVTVTSEFCEAVEGCVTGLIPEIVVCDELKDLPATGADLPDGVNVLGDDCQYHALPAATDPIVVCDELAAFENTGEDLPAGTPVLGADCKFHNLPAIPPGGGTLVDNGDGTGTYTNEDGTEILVCIPHDDPDCTCTLIELGNPGDSVACDVTLPDGTIVTAGSPIPAGYFVVLEVDSDGVCLSSIVVPTGGTGADTFVTFIDNGDGTVTLTSADGTTTVTVGAGGGTDTFVTFVENPDGTVTFTSADGTTTTTIGGGALCPDLQALTATNTVIPQGTAVLGDDCQWHLLPGNCEVTASSSGTAFTGTQTGYAVMGCELVPLPTFDPETDFPAADFQDGWQQHFVGVTGTELWAVNADPNGVLQWDQIF